VNRISLVHEYTPSILLDITKQLEKILSESEPNEERLLLLVDERDNALATYLQTLNNADKQNFVAAELITNKKLTDSAQKLLNSSLKELSKHIRGQKAVKKYK
jgi:hypothetical protein